MNNVISTKKSDFCSFPMFHDFPWLFHHTPDLRNQVSFNAAISACEKGRQWLLALQLIFQMPQKQIWPDVISRSMLGYHIFHIIEIPRSKKSHIPCKAIFCGDIPLHRPYICLIYGRYLHFRILKLPLTLTTIVTVCDDSDCGIIMRYNINNNNDHGKHAGYEYGLYWDYNNNWIILDYDKWISMVGGFQYQIDRSLDWPIGTIGEFEYW